MSDTAGCRATMRGWAIGAYGEEMVLMDKLANGSARDGAFFAACKRTSMIRHPVNASSKENVASQSQSGWRYE
ncbi:hypothetical protein [Variovorax sp. OV329]|uniref:hypothetical protein n=1 Tax=Variovorax sp. OV329 TaxID=1882825 RepID=UPI0008F3DD01|nr:hypothetical protein [Variovorax sp. OV329]SFN53820.1 hypothetical protein SAMN05444747_13511 [Variovorax sp. OV329]